MIWFDPVSLSLQSSQGQGVSYNLASNSVTNTASQAFVQVGGNVELVVMANAVGSFNLDVANVPAGARGGEVQVRPTAARPRNSLTPWTRGRPASS